MKHMAVLVLGNLMHFPVSYTPITSDTFSFHQLTYKTFKVVLQTFTVYKNINKV